MEGIMLNLYWKKENRTLNLSTKSFSNEREFETYIFKNQELLPDVFIFNRQVRTGSKEGILDLIGVDQDNRICIIEMKNEQVDEDILPQILGYAIWADTNPDSIKAMWLETEDRPEDVQIDWDNLEIRCIVIAPSYDSVIQSMASKIGYEIDLYQVQRFVFEEDEFILVEEIPGLPDKKIKTTKAEKEWTWDYYEKEHGKEATTQFKEAVDQIEKLASEKGWETPYNLNKHYTGFKLGTKVVFSVEWGGTHAWKVVLKIPEEVAKNINTENWEFQRFSKSFKNAILNPKDRKYFSIDDIEEYFELAYDNVTTNK